MKPVESLATDTRSLDALRTQSARDPQAAVRQAAGQFEALFMRQLIKSMRDAMPKSGMWDSAGQSMYQDMFDQQLAQSMAGRPGGLAEVITRQLSRNLGADSGSVSQSTKSGTEAQPVAASFAGLPSQISTQALVQARASKTSPSSPGEQSLAVGGVAAARFAAARAAAGRLDAQFAQAPDAQQRAFVEQMWPHARQAEQATGVPVAFIVGQAALESGWGRSEIRAGNGASSFNLFGIKAGGNWKGASVAATTTEYAGGQATRQVERFRAYGSYAEAFSDWASLIAENPRYAGVLKSKDSVRAYADGMQRAGYATDPRYGVKLERTINQALALKRLVI